MSSAAGKHLQGERRKRPTQTTVVLQLQILQPEHVTPATGHSARKHIVSCTATTSGIETCLCLLEVQVYSGACTYLVSCSACKHGLPCTPTASGVQTCLCLLRVQCDSGARPCLVLRSAR